MEKLSDILARAKSGETVDKDRVINTLSQMLAQANDPQAAEREKAKRDADLEFDLGVFNTSSVVEQYRHLRAKGDASGLLHEVSGLRGFEDKTFESFKERSEFPTVQEAFKAAKDFVRSGPPILTLAGAVGCGKSHLLMAIGWELVARGVLVMYRPESRLISELKRAMEERSYDTLLGDVMNCPFLLLDDLGVEALTDWTRGVLDAIVDHRWSHRLPLAVATNLKSSELPPRIADRLADRSRGKVVQISAESYRRTGGW